jgi:hypothetical protein
MHRGQPDSFSHCAAFAAVRVQRGGFGKGKHEPPTLEIHHSVKTRKNQKVPNGLIPKFITRSHAFGCIIFILLHILSVLRSESQLWKIVDYQE